MAKNLHYIVLKFQKVSKVSKRYIMQINNTSKTFKIETNDHNENNPQTQSTQEQMSPMSIDEVNSLGQPDPTAIPANVDNSDPLASYGASVTGTNSEHEQGVLDRLANFPPPVTDILAQKENSINEIHILKELYENSVNDLQRLLSNYSSLIDSGSLSAGEISAIQQKVELIQNDRLPFIAQQINECERLAAHNEYIGEMELKSLTDLNGDKHIGLKGDPRRLGITETADGKKVFLNPTTGEVVPPPFFYDTDSILTRNDTLKVLEPNNGDDVAGPNESVINTQDNINLEADVHLGLDLSKLGQGGGEFGTDIEIMIPQYWWVKNGESLSAEVRTDTWDSRYHQADELLKIDENGIRQDISLIEDKSDYRQIRVAGVRVVSHDDPTKAADEFGGAIHKIEFLDKDDNVLFCATIEGANVNPANIENFDHISAELASGGQRVYASSVGFSLNGDQTTYPMNVDVTDFKSHARQILENGFYDTLGIPADLQEEYRANPEKYMAAEDSRAFFEDRDYVSKFWQVTGYGSEENNPHGEWFSLSHNNDFQENNVCRSTEISSALDTRASLQSGVFMSGFRGDIRGSKYNDLVVVRSANEYSEEYVPEDALNNIEPIKPDNFIPYTTTYEGYSDHTNAVISQVGEGNLFASGVGFAHFEARKTDIGRFEVSKEHRLSLNSQNDDLDHDLIDRILTDNIPDCIQEPDSGDIQDSRRQPKNHVYARAGEIYLVDHEQTADANEGTENAAYEWQFDQDDYYDLDGKVYTNNLENTNILNSYALSPEQVSAESVREEGIDAWRNEFANYNQEIESLDDLEAVQTQWQEAGENYQQLAEETASFFEAMFGEREAIFAEWEQYRATQNV